MLNTIDKRCGGNGIGLDEYGTAHSIDKLEFYRGRFGEIENFDVKLLDQSKVELGIEELRKLWGLKFS